MKYLFKYLVLFLPLNCFAEIVDDFSGIISCMPKKNGASPLIISVAKNGHTTVHNDDFTLTYKATIITKRNEIYVFDGSKTNRKLNVLIDKENADNSYISMVDEVPIQRVVGSKEVIAEKYKDIVLYQPGIIEGSCEYTKEK